MKGSEVSVLLAVMTCAVFCLHVMQRNHGALNTFSNQMTSQDIKLNSLHATVDFHHKITTTSLDELSQIHLILLELLKQQHKETSPNDP